jgi:polar amino acid transport system substrate-binding protein
MNRPNIIRTKVSRVRGRAVIGPPLAIVALLVTAGCSGSGVYETTKIPSPPAPAASTPAPSATTTPPVCNALASFAPDGPNPAPNAMPPGSTMATIHDRGRLIAGVSSDTLLLGSRDPLTGQIQGFDIEMLKAVSKAIFGDPKKIEFRVITTKQRLDVLSGDPADDVDIVARAMTMTCTRWEQIDFSTQYYLAGQKVLVAKGATVNGLPVKEMADLKGQKVCAPNGSTSLKKLKTFAGLIPVGSDTHTGCLVLFQQGKVDAITGDDTILAGLAAQDPYAVVVKAPAFTQEPYGLGISKKHPDFVKFVNGVLQQMRTDGQWTTAYNTWLKAALGPAPAPPSAVYGRQP